MSDSSSTDFASAGWGWSLRDTQRMPTSDIEALLEVRLLPPVLRYDPERDRPPLPSHEATWLDIVATTSGHHTGHAPPLVAGWPDRWMVTHRHGVDEMTSSVREVSPTDLIDADPMRTSTWHRNIRARAGLRYMSSTARLHAHESLFERDLLVALDFDDGLRDVSSQPFTLEWHDGTKARVHTPDFAAVIGGEFWVINVRPAARLNEHLLSNAAALREVCQLRGWREAVVVDYRRPTLTVVETIAASRRTADLRALGGQMLDDLAEHGPSLFGDVVAATPVPALARAVLQRLIWDREVTMDLNRVLTDETLVALVHVDAVAS